MTSTTISQQIGADGNVLVQTLKKRVRQLEEENGQLKMQRFEQANAEEFKKASSTAPTQEELDRVQLTEGEYLRKYPRRRITPPREGSLTMRMAKSIK